MTARSKASRNFATRRVGMERVEDRFPYARGCMIDSWIIPNTRIQNSGLMYMVNWKKNPKENTTLLQKNPTAFDICVKDGDAALPKPGIEI